MKIKHIIFLIISFFLVANGYAEKKIRVITIKDFIDISCREDTAFQQILVEELKLKYRKDIDLPAKDLILEIESKYNFLYNPKEEDTENTVSLSKLFPYLGTDISAEYSSSVATSTRDVTSDVALELSQPIARNAFGRNTRLLDKIVGIEIDVARYQIAEAYEDYLAVLITLYYDWYSAYENLRTAENSYNENLKLLENIKERHQSKIALPIDVNKITLQVLEKKENVITRRNQYDDYSNQVKEAMRYKDNAFEPKEPLLYADLNIDFEKDYKAFDLFSRTSKVLKLLEDKSSLVVEKEADELLPSINLLLGYVWEGANHTVDLSNKTAYAGMSVEWPFPDQVDRANYETSKIDFRKTKLSSETTSVRLYTDLKNLNNQMKREEALIIVAGEKIKLAEEIAKDEKENYSLGRSTLNDLIDEVNKLENNKFNKITHNIQLRKLVVEWLRLSDSLIKASDVLTSQ